MGKVWDFLAIDNWKEYQQVKTMKEAQNLMKEMTEKNKNLQNQLKGGNKNKGEAIKMKCPKNKNVEVFWSYSDNYLGNVCNYSGITNCRLCIKKGLYPKK